MLKFRRRRRTITSARSGAGSVDLGIRPLLDDPRLRSLVGEIDPSRPATPVALDWSSPARRPGRASRRRQLLRAA